MPSASSLLSRFKRAGSLSLDSPDNNTRRSPSPSNLARIESPPTPTAVDSPRRPTSGSTYIENFNDGIAPPLVTTPVTAKTEPLSLPPSATYQNLGTPKLTLTEEGSNSPRSFGSSPVQLSASPLIGRQSSSNSVLISAEPMTMAPRQVPLGDKVSVISAPLQSRPRSGSTISRDDDARSRSGSVATTGKIHGDSLQLPDKKAKRSRRKSASSHKGGIAAALAKGGLAIAHPIVTGEEIIHKRRSKRSRFLNRPGEGSDEDGDFDEDDEEDDDESELGDDLPVHGFAVASNRRNAEFHSMFPTIDEGDYLIEDYGCAISKDILVQGRLYVSENHICFHANIFGWVTDIVVAFTDIKTIEKKMTALVIPNAIGISTADTKYTFATFIARDNTFDVLMNIWRLCNPNAVMSSASLLDVRPRSRANSVGVEQAPVANSKVKGHRPTQCSCGRDGKHFSETALNATFPSTPEKIYNLMFNSAWFKSFLSDDQKLRDVECSDWHPSAETKLPSRSTSYIKPLNGSIGPKQTKCHIVDEQLHCDYDDHIILLTTTRTPDVPSGSVFSVKTKTCLMWAGANSTKIIVTTQLEWTGKSWVKGIIEKSCIDGQKQYHDDLDKGMRAYIKAHHADFVGEAGDEAEEESEVVEAKPTEAEEYAARFRRERKDQDLSNLQYAVDTVSSGFGGIFSGIKMAFDAATDLLRGGPVAKEAIFGVLIFILVASNIYTYFAYRPVSAQERRLRRLGERGEGSRDDVAEVMRILLQDAGTTARFRAQSNPAEEARALEQLLDEVDQRSVRLRQLLKSAVSRGDDQLVE